MIFSPVFLIGFLIALLVVILAKLLTAHLLSDCSLPALLGAAPCADDIVRAGFPLVFLEEGGFAYPRIFKIPFLLLDICIGLAIAVICGIASRRVFNHRTLE